MIAGSAHIEPDGRLFILNGNLEAINMVEGPGISTLFLAGKILFRPDECGREYEIIVELFDGGTLLHRQVSNSVTPTDPPPGIRRAGATFLMQIVPPPSRESRGIQFRISVEGQLITEVDLYINYVKPEVARDKL